MTANTDLQTSTASHQPPQILGCNTISANQHKPDPDPDYIVQHLLFPGQVSMFAGPSNLGKSAIIASVCAHVAMGRDFCGLPVCRSGVLYIAAEAPKGVLNRAYPYLSQKAAQTAPFEVFDQPVDLTDQQVVAQLAKDVLAFRAYHGCKYLLIVFDTLNICMPEGDENSARDTSRVMANANQLAQTTNAHVLIVHHTGASETSRPRGSTTLTANVDTGMTLHKADASQPDGTVFINVHKQREDAKAASLAFQIRGFEVGKNRHGETTTVPWAVPFEASSSLIEHTPTKAAKARKEPVSAQRAKDLFRVLLELCKQDGDKWHKPKTLGQMSGESFNGIRGNADTMRKKVREALDTLLAEGKIEECREGVRLCVAGENQAEATPQRALH